MKLKPYQKKRNFKATKEPKGKVGAVKKKDQLPIFVIQKHSAKRLHFDLRLESGGVLKSWAVPKEPSQKAIKLLAVKVEDHPLSYADFEGEIPPDNYGAGTVIVWDKGEYYPIKTEYQNVDEWFIDGEKKGKLSFFLKGKKLYGGFTLVRLKTKDGYGENWLFIKYEDEFAGKKVEGKDLSIFSKKSIEELKEKKVNLEALPQADWKKDIKPMKAALAKKPFDHDEWIFELKLDGYRLLSKVYKGKVTLATRGGKIWNDKFPRLAEALESGSMNIYLDGEITVLDDKNRPSFQALQNYLREGRGSLVYYIFDLIYFGEKDLRKLPLFERKQLLKSLKWQNPSLIRYTEEIEGRGIEFFKAVKLNDLEGIMAKEKYSIYKDGQRTNDWLKIKTVKTQEAVVGAYTEPRGSRRHFGSLVLGVYDKNEFVYIGHTGTGFSQKSLSEAMKMFEPLRQNKSPFKSQPRTNEKAYWLKPELVCEVKYAEWTDEGLLRQPVFLHWRHDKNPKEVRKEVAVKIEKKILETKSRNIRKELRALTTEGELDLQGKKNLTIEVEGRNIALTNLDKIFWPDEKYTKGDVIAYYDRIAPFILPYLKDRLENMNRHPHGIESKGFYHKNISENSFPDWIRSKEIFSDSGNKKIKYLICQDKATLLYMAQLASIEINPWHSKADNLDYPDYAILDLDPDGNPMKEIARTARVANRILESLDVKSYCKTSGGDGLHIYIPTAGLYHYKQIVDFMRLLALLVNRELPQFTSIERSPKKREGKIYLDFLQNNRGQTIVAPYSLRPRPGARVSTPLHWEEVTASLDPDKFNIKTIFKRLEKIGDIWGGVLGEGMDMERAIESIQLTINN